MSHAISPSFDQRARKIRRNNRRVAGAAELHMGPDGLLTLKRSRRSVGTTLLKGAVFFAAVLFAAKTTMLVAVGPAAYGQALSALDGGNPFEQAGAFVMQADALTQFLAAKLSLLLG
jgi:hypothetical protein